MTTIARLPVRHLDATVALSALDVAKIAGHLYGSVAGAARSVLREIASGCTTRPAHEQLEALRFLDFAGLDVNEGEAGDAAEALFGPWGYAVRSRGGCEIGIVTRACEAGKLVYGSGETFTGALMDAARFIS